MNTYGHVIKFERIRQNIKQVELSNEICTPSYLSKIESNSIVPSEEVREKLFRRLDLPLTPSSISEVDYLKHVRSVYLEAIMKKDSANIAIQLSVILNDNFVFSNPNNYYSYLLMVIRLKVIAHTIKHDTESFIISISYFSKDFNTYQLFIFHSCLGYFHYYKNELNLALNAFERALHSHAVITTEECETADFFYVVGFIYLQHQKLIAALEYNYKALRYFIREFLYARAIESYIILAIAFKRSMQYDQALKNLLLAEKIAKQINNPENLSIIYLNLASIHAMNDNFQLAIDYYIQSMNIAHEFRIKLTNVYCIVIENSKYQNTEEIIKWSNIGLKMYEENPIEDLKGVYLHFKCHIAKNSEVKNFVEVIDSSIRHFVVVKDFRHAHKYTLALAQYCLDTKKYKKAATYFSLANEYLAKKERRKFMEDI
jgi:tetratricopeptide (TPR) repeat protein